MLDRPVPREILTLAHARAKARRERDWPEADRLRDEIEAAGWTDRRPRHGLRNWPAHPPDLDVDGTTRYGASDSVPSRLEEALVGVATVVLVATDWPDDIARAVGALADHSPDGTQVVIVDDAVPEADRTTLKALDTTDPVRRSVRTEVVRLSARLGYATALNAGIRRAAAPIVVVMDPSVEVTGDLVGPLVTALEDPRWRSPACSGSSRTTCGTSRSRRRAWSTSTRSRATQWPSAGRLRGARSARRAFRVLPEPRHLVEPRPPRRRLG